MSLLSRIYRLLGLEKNRSSEPVDYFYAANVLDEVWNDYDLENRKAPRELAAIGNAFGNDVISLLYRRSDVLIGNELEYFLWPQEKDRCLDISYWQERNPLNFPGPFYTGQTDTCGTGPVEAPANILVDSNAQEFVFRQPANMFELVEVVNAGLVEVLSSYSCDGNNYWTLSLCREWWKNRHDMLAEIRKSRAVKLNGRWTKLFPDYLNGRAEPDLRRYCYFLENGVYPRADEVRLPEF